MRAIDRRADPAGWARELCVSREAVELYLASDVVDLHIDSFIWHRVFGYDLLRRHSAFTRGTSMAHVDFPRVREAEIAGATWVITTNPLREARERGRVFDENLRQLLELIQAASSDFTLVRNASEYEAVRREGKHAAFIGVQGGNAFDHDLEHLDRLQPGVVLRVTVVHLSNSSLGTASAPLMKRAGGGLSSRGVEFVRKLNDRRIFVDLAHASPRTFWDAVAAHDRTQPLIVTHTGVCGVHRHWRNIDDRQIKAVADTGGTIGVIYHSVFLGDPLFGGRVDSIARHLEHIVDVAGEDHASLGSDWDGAIVVPRDMLSCLELPRLVQALLQRRWKPERIQKVLSGNFLRTLRALRG